jgi:thioesterase domain-containing protein
VHPTGGNVLCYFELARSLGRDQAFYGFQAAGLDGEQEPFSTIEQMAANYIEDMRTIQSDGPYLLGGWSFGGVVAFEMAQQLQEQNQEVALLALIDTQTPQYKYEQAINDEWLIWSLVKEHHLSVSYETLVQLDPDEQLDYVLAIAQRANRFPPNSDLAQVRRLFEVHKANLRALYNYRPERYENKITLFRASERSDTPLEGCAEGEQLFDDPTFGWAKLSTQPVEIEVIPGTHESMLARPNVEVLANKLRKHLDLKELQRLALPEDPSSFQRELSTQVCG